MDVFQAILHNYVLKKTIWRLQNGWTSFGGVSYLVTRSTNAILLYVLVACRVQCGIIQLLESGLEMQELTRKQKDDSTTENRSLECESLACDWALVTSFQ